MGRYSRWEDSPAFDAELSYAVRRTVEAVGNEVKTTASRNAGPLSSRVSANIVTEPVKIAADGNPEVVVRIKPKSPGYIGHFMEDGTKPRYTKKTNAFRGQMPKTPFMQPALNEVVFVRRYFPLDRYLSEV